MSIAYCWFLHQRNISQMTLSLNIRSFDWKVGTKEMTDRRQFMYLAMLIWFIPFATYAALTQFNPGCTYHQRVFTMLWLGFGTCTGWSLAAADVNDSWTRVHRHLSFFARGWKSQIGGVILLLYTGRFGSAAIEGAAIVAQELLAYGTCVSSIWTWKSEGLLSSAFWDGRWRRDSKQDINIYMKEWKQKIRKCRLKTLKQVAQTRKLGLHLH